MSAPQRPELADELRRRAEADQQARSLFGPDDEPTDAQIQHCQAVDADNTAWLAAIVTEHGWPGIRLVGEQGAHQAWLLAQHADRRPDLQQNWLTLLRAAVEAGDADRGDLAYLDDRVAAHQNIPQGHGTQWIGIDGDVRLASLADPQRVNEFRTASGLPPLAHEDIADAWPAYRSAADQ